MHQTSQVPVAHTYNPSYTGGRDQEDRGSKPVPKIVPWDPILKTPIPKKGWWGGPEPQYWKKNAPNYLKSKTH
jgi:hypothetical protein